MKLEELSKVAVQSKDGLILSCWIQPRASRNSIAGLHGDALKIALTAPPVDGKANAALKEFLADEFNLSKSSVEITSGLTGRRKCVALRGATLNDLVKRIS